MPPLASNAKSVEVADGVATPRAVSAEATVDTAPEWKMPTPIARPAYGVIFPDDLKFIWLETMIGMIQEVPEPGPYRKPVCPPMKISPASIFEMETIPFTKGPKWKSVPAVPNPKPAVQLIELLERLLVYVFSTAGVDLVSVDFADAVDFAEAFFVGAANDGDAMIAIATRVIIDFIVDYLLK